MSTQGKTDELKKELFELNDNRKKIEEELVVNKAIIEQVSKQCL